MTRNRIDDVQAFAALKSGGHAPRAMVRVHDRPDSRFDHFGLFFVSVSSPRLPSRKRDGTFPLGGNPGDAGAIATWDAGANASSMTPAEIRAELAKIFRVPRVSDVDLVSDYVEDGRAAIAALWARLADWPAFGERDLRVGRDELRFFTTIGALVGAIDRALRQAARATPGRDLI